MSLRLVRHPREVRKMPAFGPAFCLGIGRRRTSDASELLARKLRARSSRSHRTHALSLSGGGPERVTVRSDYPAPTPSTRPESGHRMRTTPKVPDFLKARSPSAKSANETGVYGAPCQIVGDTFDEQTSFWGEHVHAGE
jgi:hypothetical protein